MPELEHGEYRRLLDTVAKYALVLEREPERSAGFFTAGDMSAVEMNALIEKNNSQGGCGTLCSERECLCGHIVVALDE